MPDPQREFTAIQNERDDQILLIVEMASQSVQEYRAALDVSVGGRLDRVLRTIQRPQKIIRRRHRILNFGGKRAVVALEHFEAVSKPRVRLTEDREIMIVLDVM